MISRRGLLGGIGALLAAPAIVRVASLMPVKAWAVTDAEAVQRWLDECARKIRDELAERIVNPPCLLYEEAGELRAMPMATHDMLKNFRLALSAADR